MARLVTANMLIADSSTNFSPLMKPSKPLSVQQFLTIESSTRYPSPATSPLWAHNTYVRNTQQVRGRHGLEGVSAVRKWYLVVRRGEWAATSCFGENGVFQVGSSIAKFLCFGLCSRSMFPSGRLPRNCCLCKTRKIYEGVHGKTQEPARGAWAYPTIIIPVHSGSAVIDFALLESRRVCFGLFVFPRNSFRFQNPG